MFGMQMTPGDSTSHLAYANGRVYVLTNLGALAALDAYSGTIAWLNIYPLDLPQIANFRGGFPNPMWRSRRAAGRTGSSRGCTTRSSCRAGTCSCSRPRAST